MCKNDPKQKETDTLVALPLVSKILKSSKLAELTTCVSEYDNVMSRLGGESAGDDHVRDELLHLLRGGAGPRHLQDHGPPRLRPRPEAHTRQVQCSAHNQTCG